MIVNLRTARKLETKLSALVSTGIIRSTSVSIYSQESPEIMMDTAIREATTARTVAWDAIGARASIRRSIQKANEDSGINEMISNRQLIISQCALMSSVIELESSAISDEFAHILGKKISAAQANTSSYSDDTVSFSPITRESTTVAATKLKALITQRDDVDEKLLHANVTATIELSQTIVDFLKNQGML